MKKNLLAAIALLLLLPGCGKPEPAIPVETTAVQTAALTPRPTPVPTPTPELSDDAMVYVRDVDPTILSELHYATADNFTGAVIYDFDAPQLRYGTAKKLATAQAILMGQGFCLKIWDAYRPPAAQFRLWERCPDSTYVANPYNGYSNHSRGCTVDVTLVSPDGTPVEMPSGFDDFTGLCDRDYTDVSPTAAANAQLLESAMTSAGFTGYSGEWWHYNDAVKYPVVE